MAFLTYYNNIPQASQRLKDSQPQILTNFESLKSFVDVNHETFSSDPNFGKHKFLQMPERTSAPTTATNEMGFYTKEGSLSGVSEMFIRRENDGAQLNLTEAVAASPGYCWLAGKILMKWGYDTATSKAFKKITFPVSASIPAFGSAPFYLSVSTTFQTGAGTDTTQPRSVIQTSGPNSAPAHVITATDFWVYQAPTTGDPSNVTFFWMALGVG